MRRNSKSSDIISPGEGAPALERQAFAKRYFLLCADHIELKKKKIKPQERLRVSVSIFIPASYVVMGLNSRHHRG